MFSANENILLRQHKRRIIEHVESTIPERALDLGTSVMVMQVSCRSPGCVPLETAITIVFPRPVVKKKKKKKGERNVTDSSDNTDVARKEEPPAFDKPLIPGLEESRVGGSHKARILKPMSDVTRDDVLDALPPNFTGGRRTMESICLRARDTVFAQITQVMGGGGAPVDDAVLQDSSAAAATARDDFFGGGFGGSAASSQVTIEQDEGDVEGRKLMAQYLIKCLEEYVEKGCMAPEWGKPFPKLDPTSSSKADEGESDATDTKRENSQNSQDKGNEQSNRTNPEKVKMDDKWGKGNFVIRRPIDSDDDQKGKGKAKSPSSSTITPISTNAMEWRRHQNIEASLTLPSTSQSTSQNILRAMTEREHAPGIRRPGCPCCDADGVSTYVDKMMMY